MRLWHRKEEDPLPPVYVGSHDHKLMRIRPLHVDPDDDAMTREDKAREQAYRDADRWPLTKGLRLPSRRSGC
jgi:hypothetical protein